MPPAQDTSAIIEINNLKKSFKVGIQEVQVLKGVSAKVNYGDFAVIFGPSGCGKSTLLHIMLGLEPPTEGQIKFLGNDIYYNATEDSRSEFRKKHIGMVYQQANWVKSLTVRENVAFPLLLLGIDKPKALAKAYEMLRQVNMDEWGDYIPTELSGGQQQRVSLARALINNPEIIVADEPTGNLDFEAGQNVMKLFYELNKDSGKTVVMVTHDLEYIKYAKTAIRMFDGQIIGIYGEAEKDKLYEELSFKRISTKVEEVSSTESETDTSKKEAPAVVTPTEQVVKTPDQNIPPTEQNVAPPVEVTQPEMPQNEGVSIKGSKKRVK